MRFVAAADDATVLEAVIDLKRRQYAATGARDYFSEPQHVQLMHHLLGVRNSDFGGMLSAIYAGEDLVAAHFGMRAEHILHWWFPVYDPKFSRLKPGWMLLRALIEAAPELGLTRIDLGRGSQRSQTQSRHGPGGRLSRHGHPERAPPPDRPCPASADRGRQIIAGCPGAAKRRSLRPPTALRLSSRSPLSGSGYGRTVRERSCRATRCAS